MYNFYILPTMKEYEKHIIAAEEAVADAASDTLKTVKSKIPMTGGKKED